jgi:tetratricopeptide (TPR) repeat protein
VLPLYVASLGRFDEALAVANRAVDLDPASPSAGHLLSVQLYVARKFDEAIQERQRTLEMAPDLFLVYLLRAQRVREKACTEKLCPIWMRLRP